MCLGLSDLANVFYEEKSFQYKKPIFRPYTILKKIVHFVEIYIPGLRDERKKLSKLVAYIIIRYNTH